MSADIDSLKSLQPEGWSDIRPYHYYFTGSSFCETFKISENNLIAAIGTVIRHRDTAWLAHIIVHPDFRGGGLGRMMAETLVNSLDSTVYKTIYLDATEMGFPLYLKLGFETEAEYSHLSGSFVDLPLLQPDRVIPYHPQFRNQLVDLDYRTSGESRERVLTDHLNSALLYVRNGRVHGAYFRSLFDKFILADDAEAGTELMKLRMREKDTASMPSPNSNSVNFLLQNGYRLMRISRRMFLGEKRPWKTGNIYNRVSGGLG